MARTKNVTDVEKWLEALDPKAVPARDGRNLRAVGQALADLEEAEAALRRAVDDACAAGDSWSAIAMVLGTSKQAAHRKFARRV